MLSNAQKAFLKRLQRQAKLSDADYRALFPQVTGWADCDSSTDHRLTNAHMDDLRARMLAIARPADLKAQLTQQDQPRRRRDHRLAELQACLGLYLEDVAGYVAQIVADKFGVPAGGALTLDDLSDKPAVRWYRFQRHEAPSQVDQLVMTLSARLNTLRNDAGHTIHEMKTAADVPCDCARICRKAALVPVPEHDASEADLPEAVVPATEMVEADQTF